MVLTKPGNGGHGLEAYDDATGKYVEVSCFFNGKEVKTWEEYRDAILESNSDWKNAYETNPSVASQFDTMVQDQMFPELLQEHVDKLNKENEKYVQFKDIEDAALNIDKLFNDSLIDNLIDNGILSRNYLISVNPYKPDYRVSTIASCVQMNRYKGNNRMNPISKAEYDSRKVNFPPELERNWRDTNDDLRVYLEEATEVPVKRLLLSPETPQNVKDIVKRSFWDEKSDINSLLSRVGGKNCSYFGSCIYMAAGGAVYGDASWSGIEINGIVKPNEIKICYMPDSGDPGEEVIEFRDYFNTNYNDIRNKMVKKLTDSGKMNNNQAEIFFDRLSSEIGKDPGLCAMIMGYDAIGGDNYQLDILNPTVVDVVYDE